MENFKTIIKARKSLSAFYHLHALTILSNFSDKIFLLTWMHNCPHALPGMPLFLILQFFLFNALSIPVATQGENVFKVLTLHLTPFFTTS